MESINKINKALEIYLDNDIYKIQQIVTFVDKKNARKHISLHDLIQRINHANKLGKLHTCCYVNDYLCKILEIFKRQGFIFAYYRVPPVYFLPFLKFGFNEYFYNQVVMIYLKQKGSYNKALQYIHLISKPSRSIYISYKALRNLTRKQNFKLYILNTTKGLLTHKQALQEKIGGQLVCKII